MSALRTEAQGKRRKPDRFRASDRPAEAERGCSLVGSGRCLREAFTAWKPDRFRPPSNQQKRSAATERSESCLTQTRQPGGRKLSESDRIPTAEQPAEAERGNRAVGSCLPCAQKRRASVGSRTDSNHRATSRSGARLLGWSEVGNASGRLSQRGSRTASAPPIDQQKRSEAARWSEVGNVSGRHSRRGSRTASDS